MKTDKQLKARIQPFEILYEIGFSKTRTTWLEKLALKHRKAGRWIGVISWPDGVFSVLAADGGPVRAADLSQAEQQHIHDMAELMTEEELFPFQHLRPANHA
ncbi:hypothetical protein NJC38_25425 [Pseudomonas sp. 21LCFQ010]|uniref:hypothetical protein n=1 Tax=Pseudomonas sp. 21LCFQ010 TaxID=2957506 RepID=UPI0020973E97|nr:hypothetical protein [Pseudomonas sp. 21LCFQ010]MCO8165482.1 hypothetical protein [Pseudomonas sp. 21LCFQ010]